MPTLGSPSSGAESRGEARTGVWGGEGKGLPGLMELDLGGVGPQTPGSPVTLLTFVLRCLTFLFGFLKKITNSVKIEVRC